MSDFGYPTSDRTATPSHRFYILQIVYFLPALARLGCGYGSSSSSSRVTHDFDRLLYRALYPIHVRYLVARPPRLVDGTFDFALETVSLRVEVNSSQ